MSYANMNNVPTQTDGVSGVLAADWNTYVRDNFDNIKYGHIVVANDAAKTALGSVAEGTMVYQSDNNKIFVYSGSAWIEISDLDAPLAPFTKRIGFSTSTLSITLAPTLAGTGNLFPSITFTASGTDTYKIVVTAPRIGGPNVSGGSTDIHITNGANTSLGVVAAIFQGSTTKTYAPLYGVMYYTPPAGSTTINVSGTSNNSEGSFSGGVGGAFTYVNATLEVLV